MEALIASICLALLTGAAACAWKTPAVWLDLTKYGRTVCACFVALALGLTLGMEITRSEVLGFLVMGQQTGTDWGSIKFFVPNEAALKALKGLRNLLYSVLSLAIATAVANEALRRLAQATLSNNVVNGSSSKERNSTE